MLTLVIVRGDHIDAAYKGPRDAEHCPIALALQEATHGTVWCVEPYTENTVVATTGVARHVLLGEDCAEFVGRFDGGETVQPFSFEVDLPAELLDV